MCNTKYMEIKRLLFFLIGCIGIRLGLVFITKNINQDILQYFGFIALLIAFGFFYIYIFGNAQADSQLEWLGDKRIWWNEIRPIHGILYLLFAFYAIKKKSFAWIPLLVDVIIGLIVWILHHNNSLLT